MATEYRGTGRRKTSVAQVRLFQGNGNITVNGKDLNDYFDFDTLKILAKEPLEIVEALDQYDAIIKVKGGGYKGQAGAVRHGLSRALIEANPEFRPILKKAGMLTRDPRMVERKKYGYKKARRSPQFSKR